MRRWRQVEEEEEKDEDEKVEAGGGGRWRKEELFNLEKAMAKLNVELHKLLKLQIR